MLASRVFETPALDEINVTECHVKMSRIDMRVRPYAHLIGISDRDCTTAFLSIL